MSEGTHAAFFYGTLMAPEVFSSVCYGSSLDKASLVKTLHEFKPAILHEYCRRRVRGVDYPGIFPDKDHQVRGTYVTGLTDANMTKLDFFEGGEYERRTVKVRLLSKVGDDKGHGNVEGDEVSCDVYVFLDSNELEDREWDYEEFRTQKMKKWTRAGHEFDDAEDFSSEKVEDGEKAAAVCESTNPKT
ncbi:BtrG-like protein [Hypoxylon sp. FL1284]|nr:BtrG-like protein [Hypoxylon sp. FL1284]